MRQQTIAQIKPGDDKCRVCQPDDNWLTQPDAAEWPNPRLADDLRFDPQYPQWLDRP